MRPGATPTPEPKSPLGHPCPARGQWGAGPHSSQPQRHSVWRHPPCRRVCGTLLLNSGFDFVTLKETQGLVGASEAPKTPAPPSGTGPSPGFSCFQEGQAASHHWKSAVGAAGGGDNTTKGVHVCVCACARVCVHVEGPVPVSSSLQVGVSETSPDTQPLPPSHCRGRS